MVICFRKPRFRDDPFRCLHCCCCSQAEQGQGKSVPRRPFKPRFTPAHDEGVVRKGFKIASASRSTRAPALLVVHAARPFFALSRREEDGWMDGAVVGLSEAGRRTENDGGGTHSFICERNQSTFELENQRTKELDRFAHKENRVRKTCGITSRRLGAR